MTDHPIRLDVTDDLHRSRLTVFFRLLLAIPHLFWIALWSIAAFFAAIAMWVVALITGRPPRGLHRFLSIYVRYATHLTAYLFLAANPYPGFTGEHGYPVDITLPEPAPQPRWKTALRLVLAVPALLLAATLGSIGGGGGGGGGNSYGEETSNWSFASGIGGVAAVCALLGWFAILALGRMPNGLRDLAAYSIGYTAQAYAYLLLLTDRYPNTEPERIGPAWALPEHPVRLEHADDGRRSRLTVFFRLLLALPHIVWIILWSVAAFVAAFANWVVALARGRSAQPLHRFLAAYIRYATHLGAFLLLAANPFPGFTGEPGYPVDVAIDGPERQNRWKTLFRLVLVLPAFIVSGALGGAAFVAAFLGWFASLATGRMPDGLRKLIALSLRYTAQTDAYLFVLTDRYPYASPALNPPPADDRRAARARRAGGAPPRSDRGRGGGRLSDRRVRAIVLAALVVVWAVAAWLLWDSRVPNGLSSPAVDADAVFSEATLDRADRYELFLRVEFVVAQIVLLAVLALYAWRGARFARESAAGRIGTGMLLGMIGLALVWLSQVPFRLAEVWWARRYDQAEVGYLEALFVNWLELGAEFLFVCLALLIVMALAGWLPRRWWLAAAPAFIVLATLFAFITPFLASTDPADEELRADARRYARIQGTDPVRVDVEDVSEFTDAPNAYAAGFGPTRRIVLWSTLLDGRFSDGEVRVVLAHEIGHHSRNHIPKGLAWYALFAFPGAYLIARFTRRRGGMAQPAAVPLSLFVLVVLSLASLPLQNAISRHMEEEADWMALETTRDVVSARALFRHFATEGLSDPDPPAWSYALLDSHPSIVERLGLIDAWEARTK